MEERVTITICGDGGCGQSRHAILSCLFLTTGQESLRSHYALYEGNGRTSTFSSHHVRSQPTYSPQPRYDPTIEDSYSVTRTIDGTTYSLSITDTAGQEEYRGMWSSANLHSDAFLLVYDITSTESLAQLNAFMELIEVERETRMERGRCWPALMVVGNKCDLAGMRQVSAQRGLEWARAQGCGFMETSAREMVNIEETFAGRFEGNRMYGMYG